VGADAPASGEHERHLAISTVAQQLSQVVAVLTMLTAITVLARRLSLSEFGTYGLLVSLTGYVLFVQGSVQTVAVKTIAEATDQVGRDRAFSTAASLYALGGAASAVVIGGGGIGLLEVLNIPSGLHHQARLSVLALAVTTGIGWPLKIYQDVLRGSQRFVASAVAESIAYLVIGGLLVGLGLGGAQLWLIVAAGASLPLALGAASACVVALQDVPYHLRRSAVTRQGIREFLRFSAYLFLGGISDLVIYSLDRVILASFRSAAAVGLYEGPIRAHNFIRQIHGELTIPVLPTTARYLAERDVQRLRDLLLRGTRYTLAAVVPFVIVFMILAGPILEVWLGPRFGAAATAMTLFIGYWLVNANTGVAGSMLVAAGRIRALTIYAASVAALNLLLSLSLTPAFGLNGVVLGTTISAVVGFPFLFALTLSTFPVRLADFAREAWLPAYTTGAVIAAALLAVRVLLPLDDVASVGGASVAALLAYWTAYYGIWLRPNERALVRNVALAIVRR
jgi:O-antigen/teichoic acid export membrane protein